MVSLEQVTANGNMNPGNFRSESGKVEIYGLKGLSLITIFLMNSPTADLYAYELGVPSGCRNSVS